MAKRRRGASEEDILLIVLFLFGAIAVVGAMVVSVGAGVLDVATEPTATATATPTPGKTPAAEETPVDGVTPVALGVEVVKTVDGDGDGTFHEDETAPNRPTAALADFPVMVIFSVVIDNDSTLPVTIVSLKDDIYPDVVCLDSNGGDVVGQTLAADDGDGVNFQNMGDDEIICLFPEVAPADDTPVIDVVEVCVMGANTRVCEQDDATIRTLATPTPTPTPTSTITPTPTPTQIP